jgi:hypothetical protein
MLFDLRHTAFRSVRDIGLFLTSARSDARLVALRQRPGAPGAPFDRLHADAPRRVKTLAERISRLLTPDGIVLLVNHYFPLPNAETWLTRIIHRAFQCSPALTLPSEHKRAFFLVSVLGRSCASDLPP